MQLLLASLGDRLHLLIGQVLDLRKRLDLLFEPLLLARGRQHDAAVRNLMSPFQEDLALGRAQFLGDLLDDGIDGPTGGANQCAEGTIGFDVDALGVAEVQEGLGFAVDVRVNLDLQEPMISFRSQRLQNARYTWLTDGTTCANVCVSHAST